jgi:predicted double-glycine peptidase
MVRMICNPSSSSRFRPPLRVANFKQSRAMCGPACIKIIMGYFGKRVSEKAIAQTCRSSSSTGTTGANLVKGARKLGFAARIFDNSSFKIMETWLRRGVPVIVDWMSTARAGAKGTPMACGHYSVVCGLGRNHIVLLDPAVGSRRRISRCAFLKVWFDLRRVLPRDKDDLIIRRMIVVAPHETWSHHGVRPTSNNMRGKRSKRSQAQINLAQRANTAGLLEAIGL